MCVLVLQHGELMFDVWKSAKQTYSKLIFHGIFERHELYGGRVGCCFCIHQYFQERAFSIGEVSTTKRQTGRKCFKRFSPCRLDYMFKCLCIIGAHQLMSVSGVLAWKLLRALLLLPSSERELARSAQLRVASSLLELKPRGGLWGSSSGDIALTTDKTTYSRS